MKNKGKNACLRLNLGKILPLFVLMLALGVALPAQAQKRDKDKKNKRSTLKSAKEHLNFEEYQKAIPQIQELLQEDPRNAYYNFWMGKSLYLTYRKNQSLQYFEITEEVNPDVDKEFHHYYALALHYNLKFEKAVIEYRRDLERFDPDSKEFREINARINQCFYAQKMSKRRASEMVAIKNLGDRINTPYAEHSPVISSDNSLLVFTARRPESRGADPESGFYDEDIYVSHNVGGEWTEAENIGLPVNSKGHDATISLSADGKRLYIYRHKKDGKLYVTDFDEAGKKWKEPRAVEKPLNSKFYEASICQSADSSMLFFTSDRPGGYGGLDIYMVKREGKDWGEPKNLGPKINTPFNEDAPFIHHDGKTLYFSSDGPNGIGGYDVFVTEMDENGEFISPINVGRPINTPDDEIYFVIAEDGVTGYYASGQEGGMGEKDIYQTKFPFYHYPKRQFTVEISGIVQDANSLDTIPSIVRLIDVKDQEVIDSMYTTTAMARYSFAVEPERAYSLEVLATGYDAVNDSFSTPELKGADVALERNLFVKRIEVNEEVPEIQHIYFDFDKAGLREQAKEDLDLVAEILRSNENLELEIMAHTDWYGTYDYNVRLSEERAEAALNYLRSKGLDESRIRRTWFSENKPIEDNENDTGRQYNRRCEFHFLSGNGNVVLSSRRLRTGSEAPYVDLTPPKGKPGFDNRNALPGLDMATRPVAGGTPDQEEPTQLGESGSFTSNTGGTAISSKAGTTTKTPEGLANVRLHHAYFAFDDADLKAEAEPELDRIVDILASNPEYTLRIKGHTDSFGSDDYNRELSERRAEAVYNALLQIGVPETRMSKMSFSENVPIANNSTASGRQFNRRVEFEILQGNDVVLQSVK